MKENKISITINLPASKVLAFTIDPANTPRWINSIQKEEVNEWPVKIGSIYRNVDANGKWTEYILVTFEKNHIFELVSKEGGYHVRYTYTSITDQISFLEYFERVDNGELVDPFSQDILNNLKTVMEYTED